MRPVPAAELPDRLAAALDGGDPLLPLPGSGLEAEQVLAMAQPEIGVTEPDAAVVVATSGSTGRPKGVVLSRSAIVASATATHDRLGGPGTWLCALPQHYVAGLMVLARSVVAGTTPWQVGADLSALADALGRTSGRRYLSIVPTQLVRALQHPGLSAELAEVDAVLVGGAALADTTLARARAAGIRVVTTYGMSETSGGCVYDGIALAGVEVSLNPDTQRISIGGPMLFSGYRLRPDLTAAVLQQGRLVTADRGRWRPDPGGPGRRLELIGRVDDVVVSGGLNVDLAQVESAARSWPALGGAELAVVAVPDEQWGSRVVAVCEAGTAGAALPPSAHLEELRRFLSGALPAYAAPRQLVRLWRLPRTSSGKIDRQRLVGELSASWPRGAGAAADDDEGDQQ
nr:AMP-binding protein [Microlunatus panaciterrae]